MPSACSVPEIATIQSVRGAREARITQALFGETAQPDMITNGIKRLQTLRPLSVKLSEIVGYSYGGSVSEPLANFDKFGGEAQAVFLLGSRRMADVFSLQLPSHSHSIIRFFAEIDKVVVDERKRGTSWHTLSRWYKSVMTKVELPLKTRIAGSSLPNFDTKLITGDHTYNGELQSDRQADVIEAKVNAVIGKRLASAPQLGQLTGQLTKAQKLERQQQKQREQQLQQHQKKEQLQLDPSKNFGNGSAKYPPMASASPGMFENDAFQTAVKEMNETVGKRGDKDPCVKWFITQGSCYRKDCKCHHDGPAGKGTRRRRQQPSSHR